MVVASIDLKITTEFLQRGLGNGFGTSVHEASVKKWHHPVAERQPDQVWPIDFLLAQGPYSPSCLGVTARAGTGKKELSLVDEIRGLSVNHSLGNLLRSDYYC